MAHVIDTEMRATSSRNRLKKLETIRTLFVIPMFMWFIIILADFLFYIIQIEDFKYVRRWVSEIAFYSFPILLIYFIGATFYSSYKILESRNYKNLVSFFFFQMLAYYCIDVLEIEIPLYDKTTSIIWTAIISVVICFVISGIHWKIPLPANKRLVLGEASSSTLSDPSERMGMVISSIFSIVIASMIYFRVKGGIAFITWGVLFGTMLASMFLKADKMILGILYFLDPRGAKSLYEILKLKAETESEKNAGEVEMEQRDLNEAKMQATALRLANQLEEQLTRIRFEAGKTKIEALINKLRASEGSPPDEQEMIVQQVTQVIAELRTQQNIPEALPEPDYSSLSLGEKISQQVGLSSTDMDKAVGEDLIDSEQKHLWTPLNQRKINIALRDFQQGKYHGDILFVAKSWVDFIESNRYLLDAITTILTSGEDFELRPIKGAEKLELNELIFSTAMSNYSAVIRLGKNSSYLIVGVFERSIY